MIDKSFRACQALRLSTRRQPSGRVDCADCTSNGIDLLVDHLGSWRIGRMTDQAVTVRGDWTA
jgi:hypothetical protein